MLDRFLPDYLRPRPWLSPAQRRAIWAITHCRTPALGGALYACADCGRNHFAFHSCNHKACPRCGRAATARWVERGLEKRVGAPYFMVTFTLPEELRSCFFGPLAKEFYDLFFAAVSGAMAEKLTVAKGFQATVHGFTAVLHTWGQQMQFHPHLHLLVPGAGLDVRGKVIRVRKPDYLLRVPHLQGAFRERFKSLLAENKWQVDPAVWRKRWGVHIQAIGSGQAAIKYLGNYVARSVISDRRILRYDEDSVTFQWKDRSDHNRVRELTLPGVEFVRRYLRHVLPRGLRSIRYYGYCHPAAVRHRDRIQMHTGARVDCGAKPSERTQPGVVVKCPQCQKPMRLVAKLPKAWGCSRAPPMPV